MSKVIDDNTPRAIQTPSQAATVLPARPQGPVLVLLPVDERQKARLEASLPAGQAIIYGCFADLAPDTLQDASLILGNPPPASLKDCRRLLLLNLSTSGAEAYLAPGVLPQGAFLANAAGAYGLSVSEHLLSLLFALQRKLHLYRDNQNAAIWQSEDAVASVWGSRVLVIGVGDIGGEFARKVKALGARTIGVRRSQAACPDWLDELHTPDHLDRLLPEADVVALTVPESPESRNLLSAERIQKLKSGVIVLNVGRGSAVDTMALYEALAAGRLAGAGLDVTDPEPLPPDHPLWNLRNVLITPHVAGGFFLAETKERVIGIWADNLARAFSGQSLHNVLNT
jgi:phosphoglycerate dehydrogenase-like enzyme